MLADTINFDNKKPCAFLVVDLVDSTRGCLSYDDLTVQQLLYRLLVRISKCVVDNNGCVVKYLGDGLQAVFDTPGDAFIAARSIQSDIRQLNNDSYTAYPPSRIGLSYGSCITYEILGKIDCYGASAIMATRLSDTGRGGDINMCGRFYDALANSASVTPVAAKARTVRFKGYQHASAYYVANLSERRVNHKTKTRTVRLQHCA